MKTIAVILLLVTLQGTLQADDSDSATLKISITPQTFNVSDHTPVTIKCSIDHSDTTRYKLKLVRDDGQTIASVGKGSNVIENKITGLDFGSAGHMSNEKTSYLTVTLKNPKVEDAGTYTCIKAEDTDLGERESQRVTGELKADMIQYLLKKVNNLEHRLKEDDGLVNDEITQHIARHDEQIETLMGDGARFHWDIDELKNEITKFGLSIADTTSKVNRMVAFSASYTNLHVNFTHGDVIKFNDVTLNLHNCYDSSTGVFTAEYPGYYVFHLILTAHKDGDIHVDLMKNGVATESLRTADKEYLSQSSISAILELKEGDKVAAVVKYTDHLTDLDVPGYMYDYFTGYLIKSL